MPEVLRKDGFRFFFYSSEGNEPIHIHFMKGDAEGKIWLEPEFEPAFAYGFNNTELRKALNIADEHQEFFKQKWHEYFGK